MRIIITILTVLISYTSYGQLKTIKTTSGPVNKEIKITVPASKKMVVNKKTSGTWQPTTMQYSKSDEITLKIAAVDNQLPIFIKGLLPKDDNRALSPSEEAKRYLEAVSDLMSINDPQSEWKLKNSMTDELDIHHIKFQQVYNGIPIYGSEVIVHGNEKGMNMINGRYKTTPEIENLVPSLSHDDVKNIAIAELGESTIPEKDQFNLWSQMKDKSELVIYPTEEEMKLAYHLTTYENIVQRWEYFIDAHSGEILNRYESICRLHNHSHDHKCNHNRSMAVPPVISNSVDLFGNIKAINTYQSGTNYFMIDAARSEMFDATNSNLPNEPVGTIWTIDAFNTSPQQSNFEYDQVSSSNINFPNKANAVSAHVNGGEAFEYFTNVHNRVSINGQGGNIISLVNVADEDGQGLDNAFWNGVAMFYGNGRTGFKSLARGLDVAGHEMTHGVVQSTANLEYQGESGALNESFADIFGAMIDDDDDDWYLIGEDVVNLSAFPSGALRNLKNPHNGAVQGDFGNGFQPKKYSERFTGPEDNGGVHINSGIPNHAYYLFASNSAVGTEKAEKVFYRALTMYMTKSSQFVDARVATVQAAQDLYGDTEVAALRSAWDQVEVLGENGGNYEVDVDSNPGEDIIVLTSVTSTGQSDLFVVNSDGSTIFNPATTMDPISQPSVTDDGSEILYVTSEKELGYLYIDWENNQIVQDIIFNSNGGWRNAVFSKDGLRMAALLEVNEAQPAEVFIFDFVSQSGKFFPISNPTFSQDGTSTGDVVYADAMEFDFTGEYLMYDAFNRIEGIFGDNIEYWDIGFIKVWNNDANTFALDGQIQKLFAGLPEGISIGNPTFSKNSPFIIAYDELENGNFSIKGANLETNQIGTIYSGNDRPGYPSFSNDDRILIFDAVSTDNKEVVGARNLNTNKIEGVGQAGVLLSYDVGVRWGVWFGNGDRVISDTQEELLQSQLMIYPNPSSGIINLEIGDKIDQDYDIEVKDMLGRSILQSQNKTQIDISNLPVGQYVLSLRSGSNLINNIIVKK